MKNLITKIEVKAGDVLFTRLGLIRKDNWVCESVSGDFATMTRLEWSPNLIEEAGCCRRGSDPPIRRKIKDGLPYCRRMGCFIPRDDIKVLPGVSGVRADSDFGGSVFLANLHHAYAQTDGTYVFPNSREGDMLKTAKHEIELLLVQAKKPEGVIS